MEYVNQRGTFDDMPLPQIVIDFKTVYSGWMADNDPLQNASFAQDVDQETRCPSANWFCSIRLRWSNATHAGSVIVSGSHGGLSASHFVTAQPHKPFAVAFNDAGGGKDDAGRVALHKLQAVGMLAILYAHTTAHIGEAQDGLDNGVNALALAQGLQLGMRVSDAVRHLGA